MSSSPLSCRELVIPVAGIPDTGFQYENSLPLAALDLDLEEDRFDISQASLLFSLKLVPVKSDILVSGKISTEILAQCDRCAEMFPLQLQDAEIFHKYKNLTGDPIDLTEDIREDILMTFPQSFLCQDSCRGICPICGQNRNLHVCDCKAESVSFEDENLEAVGEDPWAILDQLPLKK